MKIQLSDHFDNKRLIRFTLPLRHGIWFSLVVSEMLGVFVSVGFLIGKRKKYHY